MRLWVKFDYEAITPRDQLHERFDDKTNASYVRASSEARPGTHGRETGATPKCDQCEFLGRLCPHLRVRAPFTEAGQEREQERIELHRHATGPEDPACFKFIKAQVVEETVPNHVRAIETIDGVSNLSDRYINESARTKRARAGLLEPSLPGLASVISDALRTSSRNPRREWLRLALVGEPIDAQGSSAENFMRAIYSTAWRVCCDELPRRFRDDLLETASN